MYMHNCICDVTLSPGQEMRGVDQGQCLRRNNLCHHPVILSLTRGVGLFENRSGEQFLDFTGPSAGVSPLWRRTALQTSARPGCKLSKLLIHCRPRCAQSLQPLAEPRVCICALDERERRTKWCNLLACTIKTKKKIPRKAVMESPCYLFWCWWAKHLCNMTADVARIRPYKSKLSAFSVFLWK